jgi:hypothetical protein
MGKTWFTRSEEAMKIEGCCHCGNITYRAEVEPNTVVICHCTDCQTLTGSAYRASIPTSADSFELLGGEPKIYIRTAENGAKRAHAFCADCGTPIYGAAINDPPTYLLRVGAIKQRAELRPRRQIWCRSALTWSKDLSGVEKLDGQ